MIKYSQICNMGGRSANEDTIFSELRGNILIAAVCDGLGSHGGGKEASEKTAEVISRRFDDIAQMSSDIIRDVFTQANGEVVKMQTPRTEMKSTAVVFCADTKKRQFIWAHVGDSRLYRFVNGRLKSQTVDHSVPQMKVSMGEITFDMIRSDPDRNRLLRAVGGSPDKIGVTVSECCTVVKKREKNAFLLCSDGFWEYVLEREMQSDLRRSHTPEEWLKRMMKRHQKRAKPNNDNFSAIAIMDDGRGVMASQEKKS